MTVRDYENDMIMGQKWAIEVHYSQPDYSVDDGYDLEEECGSSVFTKHYRVGTTSHCDFYECQVDYFRVVADEIYLVVSPPWIM